MQTAYGQLCGVRVSRLWLRQLGNHTVGTGDVRPGNMKSQGRLNQCLLSTLGILLGTRSTVMNKAGQPSPYSLQLQRWLVETCDEQITYCWVVLCREMNQGKGDGGGRGTLFDLGPGRKSISPWMMETWVMQTHTQKITIHCGVCYRETQRELKWGTTCLAWGVQGKGLLSWSLFSNPPTSGKHTVLTIPSQVPFCSHYCGLPWVFMSPDSVINSTWSFLLIPHPLLHDYFYSWAYSLSLIVQPQPLSWTPDLHVQLPLSLKIPSVCKRVRCSNFPAGLTWFTNSYLGILRCLPRPSEPAEPGDEMEAQKQNMGIFLHLGVRILAWLFQKLKFISVLVQMGPEDTWKVHIRWNTKQNVDTLIDIGGGK